MMRSPAAADIIPPEAFIDSSGRQSNYSAAPSFLSSFLSGVAAAAAGAVA